MPIKDYFRERINKTTYISVAGYFNNNILEHPGNTESLWKSWKKYAKLNFEK